MKMKAENLGKQQDFVQDLRSNLIKNPSFIVPSTRLVKQYVQVAIAEENMFYAQGVS